MSKHSTIADEIMNEYKIRKFYKNKKNKTNKRTKRIDSVDAMINAYITIKKKRINKTSIRI